MNSYVHGITEFTGFNAPVATTLLSRRRSNSTTAAKLPPLPPPPPPSPHASATATLLPPPSCCRHLLAAAVATAKPAAPPCYRRLHCRHAAAARAAATAARAAAAAIKPPLTRLLPLLITKLPWRQEIARCHALAAKLLPPPPPPFRADATAITPPLPAAVVIVHLRTVCVSTKLVAPVSLTPLLETRLPRYSSLKWTHVGTVHYSRHQQ